MIDRKKVISRVIELSGGKEQLLRQSDKRLAAINYKWHQNIDLIGRVLRAHLFIEHYMTLLLSGNCREQERNKLHRMTFAQKADAIYEANIMLVNELIPGIRRLNRIRNRLAHNLAVEVTDNCIGEIIQTESFWALRVELAKPRKPSTNVVDIIEDFAKHVGLTLDSIIDPNSLSKQFAKALAEQKT